MKHPKTTLLTVMLTVAAIVWFANRPPSPRPFSLSKSEIMASLGSMEGEVVEVAGGQNGTYRWHGEVTLPSHLEDGVHCPGPSGTSKAGISMAFPIAADNYHVIHIYDASDEGAMLVGQKDSTQVADNKC